MNAFEGPAGNMNTAAIAPDGPWAITGSHDETLRVWDLQSKTCGPGVHGHREWGNAGAISADGRRAVSGAYDGTLKVWDVATAAGIHTILIEGVSGAGLHIRVG